MKHFNARHVGDSSRAYHCLRSDVVPIYHVTLSIYKYTFTAMMRFRNIWKNVRIEQRRSPLHGLCPVIEKNWAVCHTWSGIWRLSHVRSLWCGFIVSQVFSLGSLLKSWCLIWQASICDSNPTIDFRYVTNLSKIFPHCKIRPYSNILN